MATTCSLRRIVVEKAAPTLMQMKSASLFSVRKSKCPNFSTELLELRESLRSICQIRCLEEDSEHAILFVYRRELLASLLSSRDLRNFLARYGYPPELLCASAAEHCSSGACESCRHLLNASSLEAIVSILAARYQAGGFPHEIGIFFDYPLDDVEGFIRYQGRAGKGLALWKVYGDFDYAARKLKQFSEISQFLLNRYNEALEFKQFLCEGIQCYRQQMGDIVCL
ncbi:MAG: DUF3793 family protein [Eubacteriales bacterium]|nr:DUF3793 family protein [Eubacteriales bacterium]